jgi:hypothetical protein
MHSPRRQHGLPARPTFGGTVLPTLKLSKKDWHRAGAKAIRDKVREHQNSGISHCDIIAK